MACRRVLSSTPLLVRGSETGGNSGVANGYWLDDRAVGVRVPLVSRMFTSLYRSDLLWSPPSLKPPIQWVPWSLCPGVNRQGREANHLPPTSAEVKKSGSMKPLPHMSSWRSA
jgi:hypothetical protein